MLKYGKFLPLVVLVTLTVGALVGCPGLVPGNAFKVVNFSGQVMTSLALRDQAAGNWSPNVLPEAILEDGKGAAITGIPDGIYDARAVFNTPTLPFVKDAEGAYDAEAEKSTAVVTLLQFDVPIDTRGTWEWIFTSLAIGDDSIIVDNLRLTE